MSNTWLIRHKTQVSTSVLTHVLCVCKVLRDREDTGEHKCARSCIVHLRGVEKREIRTQASNNVLTRALASKDSRVRTHKTRASTGARLCPVRLHGVEKREIRTWASTNVLARALGVTIPY